MPAARFYYPGPLAEKSTLSLEGQEFHHLAHVMRIKTGEEIELVNGSGYLAKAQVQNIDKKKASLLIASTSFLQKKPFRTILAQGMPRLNRLDFIIEKGTELGMTDLWLYPGEQSERKLLQSKGLLERIESITIAALKQCGSLYLPSIQIKEALKTWEKLEFPIFFGDTGPDAPPFKKAWQKKHPESGIIFVIGPESGLNDTETEALRNLGGIGVSLHSNILRTDTAALSALTLISSFIA